MVNTPNTQEPPILLNPNSKEGNESSIVSEQYTRGETDVKKTVSELLALEMKALLFKFGTYLLTTVVGIVIATIWTMNAKVSELQGKGNSPDKMIEVMGERLNKIEMLNQQLMQKNYDLEVQNNKLEQTIISRRK